MPVVCDRALGNTAHVRNLAAAGVHFLTALVRPEFPSYASTLPYKPLLDFEPASALNEQPDPADVARVADIIEQAGMEKLDDNLYILDLGCVTYAGDHNDRSKARGDAPTEGSASCASSDPLAEAMRLGREIRNDSEQGLASGYRSAGSARGLTRRQAQTRLRLTALPQDVQEAILRGEAAGLGLNSLIQLARLDDPEQQRAQFVRMVQEVAARAPTWRARRWRGAAQPDCPRPPLRVRAVSYFNPEMFVQMRLNARAQLEKIERFRVALNATLAKPQTTRELPAILSAVDAKLRKCELLDVFSIDVRTVSSVSGRPRYQLYLTLNEQAWKRRRRHDGFCLLVGHPDIKGTAADLCRFYRDKDTVEKDFRVIKSVIALRPFHHRLDAKIRAHVSICMLALLLERTLRDRLAARGQRLTSQSALGILDTCHLNYYAPAADKRPVAYNLTRVTEPQHKLLRALGLTHLADEKEVSRRITSLDFSPFQAAATTRAK